MSIQSNINQALGVGTALLTQSPRAEKIRETKALQRIEKGLTAEYGATKTELSHFKELKEADKLSPSDIEYYETQIAPKMHSQGQELNRVRAKLNPRSAQKGVMEGYEKGVEMTHFSSEIEGIKRRMIANEKAQAAIKSKTSQNKEMKNYIRGVASDYMSLLKEDGDGRNKTSN